MPCFFYYTCYNYLYNRGVAMEQKLKNILYILVAITLVFVCNYLIIKEIKNNFKTDDAQIIEHIDYTKVDLNLIEEYGLYSKYTIDSTNLNTKSQEWYKILLKSDCIIDFQYYNKTADISKLNLIINDKRIENEEEFYRKDKFLLNLYLYDDILVIEHQKINNRLPFIKIIDLTTGEIRNLANSMDFYINDIIINENGIKVSHVRHNQKIDHYLTSDNVNLSFTLNNEEIIVNPCDKKTWDERLLNLDYVAFDISYSFSDFVLDLDNLEIDNLKTFEEYMKIYSKEFKTKCKTINR